MFYISYKGFLVCKKAPFKIKILAGISIVGIIIRNIALIIMLLNKNLAYLYILKPLIYLNYVCMPVIVCITLCILARNNKINFWYLFIVLFASIALYTIVILRGSINITISMELGYLTRVLNDKCLKNIAFVFYTVCLMWCITLINKKNENRMLIVFAALICVISIIEIILNVLNIEFIPNLLVSNSLWLILLNCILYKIKR